MQYWIDKLGFWGYLRQFPINPITIVGGVIVIGIIVLIVNAAIRKSRAQLFLTQNPNAAIMTFHKKQIGNTDFADNIRIIMLNEEKAEWFFIKPMIPAIYLKPGENKIELFAEWARQSGGMIKQYKSTISTILVSADFEGTYSLEYNIPNEQYIFKSFINADIFGQYGDTSYKR